MILNKKGLAVLPLVALLFSCGGKSISYDEAVKFIDANYTSTEEKIPTKLVVEFSGTGADDISKKYVKYNAKQYFGLELDNNLHYKGEMSAEGRSLSPLKSNQLPKDNPEVGTKVTYSLNGKSLMVVTKLAIDVREPIATFYEMISDTTYNDQGYPIKNYEKITQKGPVDDPFSEEAVTIDVNCSYNYTLTLTY